MPRTRKRRVAANIEASGAKTRSSARTSDETRSESEDYSMSAKLVSDFIEVSQLVARARLHVARDAGVTAFQYGAMLKIADLRLVTVGALAASLSVSSQFISSEIAKLEAAGVVRRHPKENDKRGSMIELSRRGMELLRRTGPARREADESIFEGATAEEIAHLRKVMDVMRENCRRASGPDDPNDGQ